MICRKGLFHCDNMFVKFGCALLCAMFVITTTVAFSTSTEMDKSRDTRKLFGGYRITPRFCKPTRSPPEGVPSKGPSICMFNNQCSERGGHVVGACIDGFLYGTCCQMPVILSSAVNNDNTNNDLDTTVSSIMDNNKVEETASTRTESYYTSLPTLNPNMQSEISQIAGTLMKQPTEVLPTAEDNVVVQISSSGPNSVTFVPQQPSLPYPDPAETVLYHANGTKVGQEIRPVDFHQRPGVYMGVSGAPPPLVSGSQRVTTMKVESSTKPYHSSTFEDKMENVPSDKDKYVLVQTINHDAKPAKNKTNVDSSIVDILHMLDDSAPNKLVTDPAVETTTASYHQVTASGLIFGNKNPPSTSYIFNPSSVRPSFVSIKNTSKLPPSTSYISSTTGLRPKPPQSLPFSTSYVSVPTPPIRVQTTTTTRPKTPSTMADTSKTQASFVYSSTPELPRPTKKPTYVLVSSSTQQTSNPYVTEPSYAPTKKPYRPTKRPPIYIHSTTNKQGATSTKRPVIKRPATTPSHTVSDNEIHYSTGHPTSPPPTVIVLGPLNTDTSVKPTRKPVAQVTINHMVTSTNTIHLGPGVHKVSTERPAPTVLITPKPTPSYVTSSTTWTQRPTYVQRPQHVPPSVSVYSGDTTVTLETSSLSTNDLSNFPPVRNPNLNISSSAAEGDGDYTTPTFIEDDVLDKKMEMFVNKIIMSLQGPFNDLKEVVMSNSTSSLSKFQTTTKKPAAAQRPNTTKRPVRVPTTNTPTRRPTSATSRPTRTTTTRTTTTRKPAPVTTKRPRPTRRPTTTTISYIEESVESEESDESEEVTERPQRPVDFKRQCGVRPLMKSARIVGGKGATFGSWPWQVLVRESTWLGLFTKNKCGGVLISSRYVITAAHCQPGFLASLVVVAGEFDISSEMESKRSISRAVKRVIVHRLYDAATFANDLALLELESPIPFDTHIVPICLPGDDEDFTGRMATVTGWGRLKYAGGVPNILQEVHVPIMENSVCQEMFRTAGHSKIILDSFLCAGYANGQKDSCEGDSGGPLVLQRPDGRWQLAGTVSHGIKCAAPYLPGVYMRTTFYKPWLSTITGVH